ncbi:MAG: carboxypeptidase-like regulatory domain-containing protein, partial [Bacteroidales bacterium]
MKKCLVLLSCLLFMGGSLFGQQITVTGKVTNAEEGESLPGVTIQVQGTTQGTVTDVNGEYSLSVAPDATLEFRFIGMEPQDIPV